MIQKPTITDKGIIASTTDEVLQGMWSVLVAAFGTDINQALSTPQGQLATSVTATLRDRDDQMIQLMIRLTHNMLQAFGKMRLLNYIS